jgi:Na+/melibiose symporter-like transporter
MDRERYVSALLSLASPFDFPLGCTDIPLVPTAANALTFSLMVVSAFATPSIVRFIGVRWTLFVGVVGYSLYTAALYVNSTRTSNSFLLFGAAACGLSAGTFWVRSPSQDTYASTDNALATGHRSSGRSQLPGT